MRRLTSRFCLYFVGGLLVFLNAGVNPVFAQSDDHGLFDFDISEQPLVKSLNVLSSQTETFVLFPYDLVVDKMGHAVRGRFTVPEALDQMLLGTGLNGGLSKTGVLMVSIAEPEANDEENRGKEEMTRNKNFIAKLLGVFFAASAAQVGHAQDEPVLEELVVTGSRLSTAGGFNAPTPVTAISGDDLKAVSPGNIADALVEMPAMANSTPSSAGGAGSFAGGQNANGQTFLNLRGLGSNRTLIMLNGVRMAGTNANGTVDINQIPQALIRRVDVVTGGASASYGSDAVSGVVNFILDTEFEGVKVDLSAGQTDKSDGDDMHASIAFGQQYDRGRFVGAVDFYTQDGIGLGPTGRAWHDAPYAAWNFGGQIQVLPDARSGSASDGGNITGVNGCTTAACNGLINTQFLEGGVTAPFVPGAMAAGNGSYASGGDGSRKVNGIGPDRDRRNFFLHGEYDLTDDTTVWAQVSFGTSKTDLTGQPAYNDRGRGPEIIEGNPYIPDDVAAILAADPGVQTIEIEKYWYDENFARSRVGNNDDVERFAAGLRGELSSGWGWDVSMYHQETDSYVQQVVPQTFKLHLAADVVEVNGEIGCYATLVLGNAPNCQPLNVFGPNAASVAASDYINGVNWQRIAFAQSGFEANVRGDLGSNFTMTTDPVSVAAGFTHYRSSVGRIVDRRSGTEPNCNITDRGNIPGFWCGRYYAYGNPLPFPTGEVSVTELYGEAGIPLVRDAAGVQALDLSLAARATNYSQSGMVYTWKTGLNWEINDAVRLRATQSRDIRAPSPTNLFESGSTVIGTNDYPFENATNPVFPQELVTTKGNPNLGPEKADTTVIGVVFRPESVDFQASIDYYKIDIEDAISGIGAQNIVNLCYQGDQGACSLITIDGDPVATTDDVEDGDIVTVINGPVNVAVEDTAGLDIEMIYRTELGAGNLSIRTLATHLLKYDTSDDPSCEIQVGAISGFGGCGVHPEWVGQMSIGYNIGNFGINWRQRYIHSGQMDPNLEPGDITFNDVPSVMYSDVRFSYDLGSTFGTESASVFFNVNNLFDKEPPVAATSARAWAIPTANGLYDILGLRYTIGVKAEF